MEIPTISVNLSANIIEYTTNTTASCEYEKRQRKLQKRREEKELEERRKQKERMKEAQEAYAKYRRELRHYYNELGYQKRLAASTEGMAVFVDVKKPPVASDAYEIIMMLGM